MDDDDLKRIRECALTKSKRGDDFKFDDQVCFSLNTLCEMLLVKAPMIVYARLKNSHSLVFSSSLLSRQILTCQVFETTEERFFQYLLSKRKKKLGSISPTLFLIPWVAWIGEFNTDTCWLDQSLPTWTWMDDLTKMELNAYYKSGMLGNLSSKLWGRLLMSGVLTEESLQPLSEYHPHVLNMFVMNKFKSVIVLYPL